MYMQVTPMNIVIDATCLYKGNMIRDYLDKDFDSAILALEWLVQDWPTDCIGELILKLFYKDRIYSPKFAQRVYGIIHQWEMKRIQELILILLVGEPLSTIAAFISNFRDKFDCSELLDMVSVLYYVSNWSMTELFDFLMEYLQCCVPNLKIQKTLLILIELEFDKLSDSDPLEGLGPFDIIFKFITIDGTSLLFDEDGNEIDQL